jgi:hypothetical protein
VVFGQISDGGLHEDRLVEHHFVFHARDTCDAGGDGAAIELGVCCTLALLIIVREKLIARLLADVLLCLPEYIVLAKLEKVLLESGGGMSSQREVLPDPPRLKNKRLTVRYGAVELGDPETFGHVILEDTSVANTIEVGAEMTS